MKFYSAWYCPFAQRVWMALAHKGVDFELIETDPYNKTARWMQISAGTGQVPVLVSDGGNPVHVPDSLRCLEFVDAFFKDAGLALYPADPTDAAETRFWTDFLGRRVVPNFYRFLKAEPGSLHADAARGGLEQGLSKIVAAASPQGPFFRGTEIGAVDLALAPFSYRIGLLLEHYRGYQLPRSGQIWRRYHVWAEAMHDHPSFLATRAEADYDKRLISFYQLYADGAGQVGVDAVPA